MGLAGANLVRRCCVGVMIALLMVLAGKGKDGQGSFHSAKCMRRVLAKKNKAKRSYEVGLQFTCIIRRLVSDERSREGSKIKFYGCQEWGSEL